MFVHVHINTVQAEDSRVYIYKT